jgi:hypothetical protein
MPNSSARCAQLPRAIDKVPFYEALKKFRDYLNGSIKELDETEVVFTNVKLKNFNEGGHGKRQNQAAAAAAAAAAAGEGEFKMDFGEMSGGSDGRIDPITGKKRRGRPPKARPDGTVPPPKRRQLDGDGNPIPRGSNPIDPLTGKKKRGRPKKSDLLQLQASTHNSASSGAPKVKKEATAQMDNGSSNSTTTTASSLGNNSSNAAHATSASSSPNTPTVMQNKPTKIVPPLPPFSPNFGSGVGNGGDGHLMDGSVGSGTCEDKPVVMGDEDLHKSSSVSANHGGHYDSQTMHDQNSRLPSLCADYQGNNEAAANNSEDFHHPGYQQQYQQHKPDTAQVAHYPGNQHSPAPGGNFSPYHNSGAAVPPPPPPPTANANNAFNATSSKGDDVTTKSITGLESLVDQIPALAENESGVFSGGSGSAGNTPRSVGPYSPAASSFSSSSFHTPNSSSAAALALAAGAPYGSSAAVAAVAAAAAAAAAVNHYNVPSTSDSLVESTNNYPVAAAAASSATTDFSVNSLVQSSGSNSGGSIVSHSLHNPVSSHPSAADVNSDPFSVSSLTSDMASKYHHHHAGYASGSGGGSGGNPYHGMFPSSAGSFGASGFLGGAATHPAMASAMGPMGPVGMPYYGQYSNTAYATAAAAAPGFGPSPYSTHGLHMPNPSYPYPSPYGQSPYSQSPYF